MINRDGERVYTNHLKKISSDNETIYLIGNKEHKKFMKSVFKNCMADINYSLIQEETYKAVIKDPEGEPIEVKNYMMTIRNNSIKVYHKN